MTETLHSFEVSFTDWRGKEVSLNDIVVYAAERGYSYEMVECRVIQIAVWVRHNGTLVKKVKLQPLRRSRPSPWVSNVQVWITRTENITLISKAPRPEAAVQAVAA